MLHLSSVPLIRRASDGLHANLEVWIPDLSLLGSNAGRYCFPYYPLAAKLCCCNLSCSTLAHDMHNIDGRIYVLGQVQGSCSPLVLHIV